MRTLFFCLLIFTLSNSNAQNNNPIDVGSLAVLVQTGSGSGSGFYLADSTKGYIYLATASHVLIDPIKKQLYSDSIFLISYQKNSQRDNRDSFRVSLLSAYKLGMFIYNIQKDVAVIKIALAKNRAIAYEPFVTKLTATNTYLHPLEIHDVRNIDAVQTMAEIYTVGYPKSLALSTNFDYNRPLVRKGIVAGIDIQKDRIIADCPVYQGNSGGVVFQTVLFDPKVYVIGLISQFVPFEEHWINQAYGYYNTNIYNSGYSVIIPIDDVINEIAKLR